MHSTIFLGPAMKVSSSLQKPNCNLDMSEVRWFVSIKKVISGQNLILDLTLCIIHHGKLWIIYSYWYILVSST